MGVRGGRLALAGSELVSPDPAHELRALPCEHRPWSAEAAMVRSSLEHGSQLPQGETVDPCGFLQLAFQAGLVRVKTSTNDNGRLWREGFAGA